MKIGNEPGEKIAIVSAMSPGLRKFLRVAREGIALFNVPGDVHLIW
jgi:hypothetical protein